MGCTCRPHSFAGDWPSLASHHQRPARKSSPRLIARVQGAQPMLGKKSSCNALYDKSCSAINAQTSPQDQLTSGLSFKRGPSCSRLFTCARPIDCSRRSPVSQPTWPAKALDKGCIFLTSQHDKRLSLDSNMPFSPMRSTSAIVSTASGLNCFTVML